MLLRNRERRGRSHVRLAIFATASLIFVVAAAIIFRTRAIEVSDIVPVTPDNVYSKTSFYKKYNDLGAIGSFHLIAFAHEAGNIGIDHVGAINGNVATRSMNIYSTLGVTDLDEIHYIRDAFYDAQGSSFFKKNGSSIIVFGRNIEITENPSWTESLCIDHSCDRGVIYQKNTFDEVWQDDTADFLDMDVFRNEAIDYNLSSVDKYLTPDPNDPDYPNMSNTKSGCIISGNNTTCTVQDNTKVSYINLSSSDNVWNNTGYVGTLTINNAAPEGITLLNIDGAGVNSFYISEIVVNMSNGTSINQSNFAHYTEEAETNIVLNFYDSSSSDRLYHGTIGGDRLYGMIVAPAATVSPNSIRGTVIAETIKNVSSTYQSNFVGHLVYYPKTITVHHVNGDDGTTFAADDTYTVYAGDPYAINPVSFDGNVYEVEYDGTYQGVDYAETGNMPDIDIEVTYTYSTKKYDFTVHHYLDGTTTSYKPDHVEHLNPGDPYEALPDTSNQNYEYYLKTGDSATGTMGTDPVTVTYYYKKKVATLTVTHIVDGSTVYVGTSDIEWGEEVPRDSFLPAYTDSHNHTVTVDPDVTTVSGDVAVTYTYTIKSFSFTVHHYYDGTTTSYKPDHSETLNYGAAYTATPDTSDANYEYYLKEGDSANGNITEDTVVTYYYKKKTATLTIIDVVDGTSTTRSTTTVEWGDSVARDEFLPAYADSHNHSVSVSPDVTTVSGDVTVTYTYNIKKFTLTVHHVNNDANYSRFAEDDITTEIPYGTHYDANPIVDDNYTVTVKSGSDSVSGNISKDIVVTYVYTRKIATVTAIHIDSVTGNKLRDDVVQYNLPWGTTYVTVPHSDLVMNYDYTTDIAESGTINADNITVTYTYTKKTATLTIIDVVDGVSTIRSTTTVEYGDSIPRNDFLPAYADSHNHSVYVNPDVATVSGDVTVTYTYTIKSFEFRVHHYYENTTNQYKPDYTEFIDYGGTYTAVPDTSNVNYEYHLKEGDSATGTVTDYVTVTYYYRKKTATLTIIDVVDGTSTTRSTTTVEWGDDVARDEFLSTYADSHNHSVSVSPDVTTVSGDVTVTYTYTIKTFEFRVHHYYDGTETSYKPDHTETLNYGSIYTATPNTDDINYEYYLKEGDSATGGVTGPVTVTYYYKKKTATLTIIDVVDGVSTTRSTTTVEWGDDIARNDFLPAYDASHDHSVSVSPDVTKVAGDVTVTYTYSKKDVVLTVHHLLGDGSNYVGDTTTTYKYGDPYEALPDTHDNNYEYAIKDGDSATGTITSDMEVTYFYRKKTATLTIIDVVDGVSTTRSTTTVEWGDNVVRNDYLPTYADSHNHSVSVNPDVTVVSGDVTVTYTYTIKTFTFTVHHYYDGTTNSYKPDHTEILDYGATYTATPDTSDVNYEYYLKEGDSANGNITEDTVVTYYYKKKTATFTVIHQDSDGTILAPTESVTKDWGDEYEAHPSSSLTPKYDYTYTGGSESGTIAGDVTIVYTYTKKIGHITAVHVDKNGNKLAEPVTQNIEYDLPYQTVPAGELTDEYDYTTDKAETGIVGGDVTVTYTYTKKTYTFTVHHYYDGTTNSYKPDHTETLEHGAIYTATPDTSDVNYEYHLKEGDSSTGTVAGPVTVTYYYKKKTATLTIIDVVDGVSTTRSSDTVEWGDDVVRNNFLPAYDASHNHSVSVSPDVTKVAGDVTVTYTYTIKTFTFTVHHYYDGTTNSYKPDHTETINYGGDYTAIPDSSDANYEYYLKEGDSATGPVTNDVTVTYYYKKKTATLTIIDVVDGASTTRSTTTVEWGDDVARDEFLPAYANSHNHSVSVNPDVTKVSGDVTVTYSYTIKTFTFTVHHYYDGTTNSYKPDHSETLNYGAAYTATPDTSDINYEYHLKEGDSAAGTITSDKTVTYYYKKKTATFTVKHQDMQGNTLAPTESVTKDWGDEYHAYPAASLVGAYQYTFTGGSESGIIQGDVTIIYKYTKKAYILTVHHIYEDGSEYKPDTSEGYEHGDHYTAVPDTSDNNYEYRLKEGDSASGEITSNLEVTFIYKKKTANLTVIHIVDGEEVSNTTTTVEWGDDVDRTGFLPEYNASHDHTVTVEPDVTKVAGNVTVTYRYTIRQYTLTVHHRYENGSEYKPDVTTKYAHGATYTAVPDTSDNNYEYRLANGDKASDIILDNTEVTYIYKKKVATFIVIHKIGGEEHSRTETQIDWGETYHAHPASDLTTAYNYTTDKSESGIVSGDVTVTYTYTKKTFSVTVHHVKVDGSPFANDDTDTVEYGDSYTAVAKEDPSYNAVVTEGALVNDNITNNLVITIQYVLKQGKITVKHLDQNGSKLAEEEHYDIDYGSSYSVHPNADLLEAYDYTVDVAESDTVAGDVTITYTYTKKRYTLTVHYRYENGSQYKPDYTHEYEHGDTYTAPADESDINYEWTIADNKKQSDVITSDTEIIFVYKKKTATFTIRHLDKNGNSLVEDEVTTLNWGDTYEAHPASSLNVSHDHTVDKDERGLVAGDVTVTYTYTKKKFTLTIHHVDTEGNPLGEDTEVVVEYGDKYNPAGLASLINDYDFEVDPETPIPDAIIADGEYTLVYTKKPEVPKTNDNILPIIAGVIITLAGAGATIFVTRKRRA